MSVFLTPDLRPFTGGTYFPPDDRYGRPGFKRILLWLADAWLRSGTPVMSRTMNAAMPGTTRPGTRNGRSGSRARRVATAVASSATAIPDLLGVPPTGRPQAELWMGAHPSAPSRLDGAGPGGTLADRIAADPQAELGKAVLAEFGPRLPFLFKVLAAHRPLSLQAHPSLEQARAGYAAEDALGIPLDAPHRSYKDPSHKPKDGDFLRVIQVGETAWVILRREEVISANKNVSLKNARSASKG